MSNRFIDPAPQFVDSAGLPRTGGYLYFYVTGSTTPAAVWQNAALSSAASNPQTLDSLGNTTQQVFLDPSITYSVVLKTSAGVEVWSRDPVVDPAANVTARIQVYSGNPNGNVAGSAGSVGGAGASAVYDIANQLLYVCTTTGTASTAVWTQVAQSLSGQITQTGVITPTALAASTDDWNPSGLSTASIVRIQASAAYNLTGITAQTTGTLLTLHNIGSFTITLRDGNVDTTSTAANRFTFDTHVALVPNSSISLRYDGVSSRWRMTGVANPPPLSRPGGRLTLTTGTPVQAAEVTAGTTIYYTPYQGFYAPLYNGAVTVMVSIGAELSLVLDNNSGHTGYQQSGKNFDLFLYEDSGTMRLVSGPAWTNDTARATSLEYKNGFLCNAASMAAKFDSSATTLTVAQDRGLFIGTMRGSADGQVAWIANPTAAAGGGNCKLFLWNMYHRVPVSAVSKDSTDSWNYTTATWRAANAAVSSGLLNRITAVFGRNEDIVEARYHAFAGNSTGSVGMFCGVGLDVTNAFTGFPGAALAINNNPASLPAGVYIGLPGEGARFFQAVEYSVATGTTTWWGDNAAATVTQSALMLRAMM